MTRNAWAEYWAGHRRKPLVTSCEKIYVSPFIREVEASKNKLFSGTISSSSALPPIFLEICKEKITVKVGTECHYEIPIVEVPAIKNSKKFEAICVCGRKARILYSNKGVILCRKCFGLKYPSQLIEPSKRHILRICAAENKLNTKRSKRDTCTRPFYMHRKTYHRLLEKVHEAEEAMENYLGEKYPEHLFYRKA